MFLEVVSDKLGLCTKAEVCFKLDNNVTCAFKSDEKVTFVAIKQVDELNRLGEKRNHCKCRLREMGSSVGIYKKGK